MILFRALVVRWIARHRIRSALAVAAVALGVAAFLATAAVGSSVERTATAAVAAISGGSDLGIEADTAGVPASWASEVREVPGVAAASPVLLGWVNVAGATKGRPLLVGADLAAETRMRRSSLAAASAAGVDALALATGAGAVLTRPLAEELGLARGGAFVVPGPSGPVTLRVAGVVEPTGGVAAAGGRAIVATLPLAQRLLGRGAAADRIDVDLVPGADRDAVARAIVARIGDRAPPRLYVGAPRPVDPTVSDVLGVVTVALRIGAAVALMIGVFLIHHTVSVGVAERRRDVGMLRALGATRSQVRRVFAGEAIVLGALGASIGVGLALLLAAGALRSFAGSISTAYFASEPAPAEISWPLALAGVAIGAAVSLAAAWIPASRAARQAPSDAIRRGSEDSAGVRIFSPVRVAATSALAAGAAVFVALPDLAGRWTGYIAAALALLAYLTAAPAVLALGAKAIAPVLARRFGVPGRLAADQLARHPTRAALPSAALALGLALVIETAGTMTTLSESTIEWMDEQVAGDLFVSSGRAVMGAAGHNPLEASLAREIAATPGVAHVSGVRFRHVAWRDTKLLVLALDIAEYRKFARLHVGGGPRDEVLARLEGGAACLVSANLTHLHGVGIGDTLDLPGARRPAPLAVVGSFDDYSWPRGTVLVDRAFLVREMDDALVDEFSVKLANGADPAAASRAVAAALGEERDVVVTSARALQEEARTLFKGFFSLAYAQVAAALSVAFLGVVNSLWISVVLRRRELGLIRAVGATRSQVTRSIVLEAAGLGVIGAVCGLVGGALVEWLAIHRVLPADTGWVFPLHFPWAFAATTAVLGVASSALAGLLPARAAARFDITDCVSLD
jgi:putative ABC transport system permease protein